MKPTLRFAMVTRAILGTIVFIFFRCTSPAFADTSIDATWLSTHGPAPYILDQANTTYTLQNDIAASGTAFVVGAANVTLDLNGHTIRYGDSSFVVNNAGFEQGMNPTDVPGWDVTGATGALRAQAIRGMWGSWCLQVPNVTASATIISDPILISKTGREYAAVITPYSGSYQSTVKLEVIDAAGTILGSGTSANPNRGMSAVAKFTPTATVSVRLRVTMTPAFGQTDTFFLDGAALLPSQDFGIVASRASWYFPAQLKTTAITNAVSNTAAFALKNGTVDLSRGGYASSGIYAVSVSGLTVDGVTFTQEGSVVDAPAVEASYASNTLIQNSTFNFNESRDIQLVSNRMAIGSASVLDFMQTSGNIAFINNHLVNFPQVGISVTGTLSTLTMTGNRLEGNAQTTNSYALVFSALQVVNPQNQPGQISNNIIIPLSGLGGGEGIIIDGWNGDTKNLLFQNNDIEIFATGDIEYPPSSYVPKAVRMRNESVRHDNITFDGNTLIAWTDAQPNLSTEAMAVRLSIVNDAGQMNGAQVRFTNNQITAYTKNTDSSYHATALSLSEFAAGSNHSFIGNTFSSNDTAVGLGDAAGWKLPVSGVNLYSNAFERLSSSLAPSRPFQAIYAGRGSNPVSNVWFIDNRNVNWTDGQLSAKQILFYFDDPKDVELGWFLDVNAKDNLGNPVPGAAIQISDKASSVYNGSTDATGAARRIPLVAIIYRQLTSDPNAIVVDDRNPFMVNATSNAQSQSQGVAERGNQAVSFTFSLVPDTIPPVVYVDNPLNGAAVAGTIPVSAQASDNIGVRNVEFYLDGLLKTVTNVSPYTTSLDTTTLSNAAHSLTAKAYDAAGNIGISTAVSMMVNNTDVTAPITNVTSPSNGATISGTITFSASATDNVGVTKVEFYVDGALRATSNTSPYSTSLDTAALANGSHKLISKAYDAAGNIGTSASISINVSNVAQDATPPTVTITSATVSKGILNVSANATDNIGVTCVEFYVDGKLKATDTTAPYGASFGLTGKSGSSHSVQVKAYDAAGNVASSSVMTVTR